MSPMCSRLPAECGQKTMYGGVLKAGCERGRP